MALKKVQKNFERLFDKNLTDLVRGLRNNKDNEVSYKVIYNDLKERKKKKTFHITKNIFYLNLIIKFLFVP